MESGSRGSSFSVEFRLLSLDSAPSFFNGFSKASLSLFVGSISLSFSLSERSSLSFAIFDNAFCTDPLFEVSSDGSGSVSS